MCRSGARAMRGRITQLRLRTFVGIGISSMPRYVCRRASLEILGLIQRRAKHIPAGSLTTKPAHPSSYPHRPPSSSTQHTSCAPSSAPSSPSPQTHPSLHTNTHTTPPLPHRSPIRSHPPTQPGPSPTHPISPPPSSSVPTGPTSTP